MVHAQTAHMINIYELGDNIDDSIKSKILYENLPTSKTQIMRAEERRGETATTIANSIEEVSYSQNEFKHST